MTEELQLLLTPAWEQKIAEARTRFEQVQEHLALLERGDPLQRAALDGRAFRAGTGVLGVGGVTPVMDATLENPANSGETMIVHELAVVATQTVFGTFVLAHPGAPLALPILEAPRPVSNAQVGGPVSKQIMRSRVHATGIGGGIPSGISLGIPANTRQDITLTAPILVPPGLTLGLSFPFTGLGQATLTVVWRVEPV